VTALCSEEGEKLPLTHPFNPGEAKGNVEKWFIQAEQAMRESVRDVSGAALAAHAACDRLEWLLAWPGQVRHSDPLRGCRCGDVEKRNTHRMYRTHRTLMHAHTHMHTVHIYTHV
jgi:hypothetical protein